MPNVAKIIILTKKPFNLYEINVEVEAIYIRTNNQSISIFRCQVSTNPIQPLLQQKKAHLRWKTWNSYY